MNLLILTQKVDRNDGTLGFFHRWVEEFSYRFSKVIVVCIEKGESNLPPNVKILSLGKEREKKFRGLRRFFTRIFYVFRFYKFIWKERRNYDTVFVHMSQEFVLLGGIIWRLKNKKLLFWRNHAKGNFLTRLSVILSDKVFCTSPDSFTARFKKTDLMPVGIDTEIFKPDERISKKPNSILYVGRISPVKKVELFIDSLNKLLATGSDFTASIVGELSFGDPYVEEIRRKAKKLEEIGRLRFLGQQANFKMPEIYNNHKVLVNLTEAGSFDKTIFEAMSCGLATLVHNQALDDVLGSDLIAQLDSSEIAEKLAKLLKSEERYDFRSFVVKDHSLTKLMEKFSRY